MPGYKPTSDLVARRVINGRALTQIEARAPYLGEGCDQLTRNYPGARFLEYGEGKYARVEHDGFVTEFRIVREGAIA